MQTLKTVRVSIFNIFRTSITLLSFVVLTITSSGQQFSIESGNTNDYSGAKSFLLTYVMEGMPVDKYATEQEYIEYRKDYKERLNPGDGEAWLASWNSAPELYYLPKFIELFEKYGRKNIESISTEAQNQHFELKLIVNSLKTGSNKNGIVVPASLDLTIVVSDTSGITEPLVISVVGVEGVQNIAPYLIVGEFFPDSLRIAEAFANLGKRLAKYMGKEVY